MLGFYDTAAEEGVSSCDPWPVDRRHAIAGTTKAGRLLTVVYTIRTGRIRVVTARDAMDSEADEYDRHNR